MLLRLIDKLYIGDSNFTDEDLEYNGINYVLNLGGVEIKTKVANDHIHLKDDGTNTKLDFSTTLSFIDEAIQRGYRTLVCCREGRSRSVSMAVQYFMKYGWSKDDALAYIKKIDPLAQVHRDLWRSF